MISRLAIINMFAVLSPLAAQTITKNVQDYLPLAVGNSWTYKHEYWDERRNKDGTKVPEPTFITRQFTISILETEVIDGETYYVFSDIPNNWPAKIPKHFIAGKKLRWEGNNLTEHDGSSSFSIYRFNIPTDHSNPISGEYSIPTTQGDNRVKTHSEITKTSQMIHQYFSFEGYTGYTSEGNWDPDDSQGWNFSRSVYFVEKFGIRFSVELIGEYDAIIFENRLKPVRAVLHTASGGGSGNIEESAGVTIEWDDFNCFFRGDGVRYNKTCNYSPTSISSTSWGQAKKSWNGQ